MDEPVPTYGLLMINHAYNEGRITFKQWLEQSREWALKMKKYDWRRSFDIWAAEHQSRL